MSHLFASTTHRGQSCQRWMSQPPSDQSHQEGFSSQLAVGQGFRIELEADRLAPQEEPKNLLCGPVG